MELQILNDVADIIERPDNYPVEQVAAVYEAITGIASQIREAQARLKGRIIKNMKEDNATKLFFKSGERELVATLSAGSKKSVKDADVEFEKAGFSPLEIGSYEFKPSWSKAKSVMKVGGPKRELIEKIFIDGEPTIVIDEV